MCISSFLQISGPHPELYLIKWSGTARERSVHLKNPPQRLKSVSISKYNNAIWKTLENSVSSKLCICQSKYYNSFSVINNYDLQCSTIHDSITKAIHQNELLSYQKFLFVNTFLQNTMLSRKNIKKEKTKEKKKRNCTLKLQYLNVESVSSQESHHHGSEQKRKTLVTFPEFFSDFVGLDLGYLFSFHNIFLWLCEHT